MQPFENSGGVQVRSPSNDFVRFLCLIHRGISFPKKCIWIFAVLRENRYPYADANSAVVALDFHGRCQVSRDLIGRHESAVVTIALWLK